MHAALAAAAVLACLGVTCLPCGAQSVTTLDAPETLSAWELFSEKGDALVPHDAVVYDLNSSLFSDYALKLRTLRIPPGTQAKMAGDEIEFPIGTVISKTFYYLRTNAAPEPERWSVYKADEEHAAFLNRSRVRLLETRLLVNTETGWIGLPYVWDADQTDATLQLAGESMSLRLMDGRKRVDFDYLVPDANQCASCHAGDGTRLHPIGLKTRHLNKTRVYDGKAVNQLAHWRQLGILDSDSALTTAASARWDDPKQSIDARARAYLDVNCSHCHGAQGAANHSGLWLTPETHDPIQLGLCKPPVATGRGSGDAAYVIVPGKPRDSILLHRMQSTEPDVAMPEIGRSLVHQEGVELIEAWIRSMPSAHQKGCAT